MGTQEEMVARLFELLVEASAKPGNGDPCGLAWAIWNGALKDSGTHHKPEYKAQSKAVGKFIGALNAKGVPLPTITVHPQWAPRQEHRDPYGHNPSPEEALDGHEFTNPYGDGKALTWEHYACEILRIIMDFVLNGNRLRGRLYDLLGEVPAPPATRALVLRFYSGELFCACTCDHRQMCCQDVDTGPNYQVVLLSECMREVKLTERDWPELGVKPAAAAAAVAEVKKPGEPFSGQCLMCKGEEGELTWAGRANPVSRKPSHRWRVMCQNSGDVIGTTFWWFEADLCQLCSVKCDQVLGRKFLLGRNQMKALLASGRSGDEFDQIVCNQDYLKLNAATWDEAAQGFIEAVGSLTRPE